jgi:hypothetical protein
MCDLLYTGLGGGVGIFGMAWGKTFEDERFMAF